MNRSVDSKIKFKANVSSFRAKLTAPNISSMTSSVTTASYRTTVKGIKPFLKVNVSSWNSRGTRQKVTIWKRVANLRALQNNYRNEEAKKRTEQRRVKAQC